MKGAINTLVQRRRKVETVDANEKPKFYDNLFDDLVKQTPKKVWEQYLEDGYSMREAIKEERSQA
jgi:predicted CoA-binding protein